MWFKVDDGHNDHPKVERLEELCAGDGLLFFAARGVWEAMGVDCGARETDGAFSAMRFAKITAILTDKQRERVAALLIEARLWDPPQATAMQFHDWADYQPTKAQLVADRRSKTDRQKRWRSGTRDASVDASTQPSTDASRHGASNGSRDASKDGAHARVAAGGRAGSGSSSESSDPDPERARPTDWIDVAMRMRALSKGILRVSCSPQQAADFGRFMDAAGDQHMRDDLPDLLARYAVEGNGFDFMADTGGCTMASLIKNDASFLFGSIEKALAWEAEQNRKATPIAVRIITATPAEPTAADRAAIADTARRTRESLKASRVE